MQTAEVLIGIVDCGRNPKRDLVHGGLEERATLSGYRIRLQGRRYHRRVDRIAGDDLRSVLEAGVIVQPQPYIALAAVRLASLVCLSLFRPITVPSPHPIRLRQPPDPTERPHAHPSAHPGLP